MKQRNQISETGNVQKNLADYRLPWNEAGISCRIGVPFCNITVLRLPEDSVGNGKLPFFPGDNVLYVQLPGRKRKHQTSGGKGWLHRAGKHDKASSAQKPEQNNKNNGKYANMRKYGCEFV